MTDQSNPFAAPLATDHLEQGSSAEPGSQLARAEMIRHLHLKHEASVKSIALFYWLLALFTGVGAVAALAGRTMSRPEIIIAWLLIANSLLQIVIGYGIRRLLPWGRMVGIVLSPAYAISFPPFFTVIHGYFLYLFLCAKGRIVFSNEYRQIIEMTPHIKSRTSLIVKILLGLLFLVLMGLLILVLIG